MTRIALVLLLIATRAAAQDVGDLSNDFGPGASIRDTRGLNLDLEACIDGGCVSTDGNLVPQPVVTVEAGTAFPVRIRLHLDCSNVRDTYGVAAVARIVLIRPSRSTFFCPMDPPDAYCTFRWWADEVRWDDQLVAEYWPEPATTAWPDPERRVDEAEVEVAFDPLMEWGDYDLVAALPSEVVSLYPCEDVREHPWIESPRLRIHVGSHAQAQWERDLRDLRAAGLAGDAAAARAAIQDLAGLDAADRDGRLGVKQPDAFRRLIAEALASLDHGSAHDATRELLSALGQAVRAVARDRPVRGRVPCTVVARPLRLRPAGRGSTVVEGGDRCAFSVPCCLRSC